MPDDITPLKNTINAIIKGEVDLAFFTSARQIDHLLFVAAAEKQALPLRRALQRVGIISIGPVTTERLSHHQLFADYEANPHKLDDLVSQAANHAQKILLQKRARTSKAWIRVDELKPSESIMMQALAGKPVKQIPVWLMRQAGRYMAEYQLVRSQVDFLTLCKTPDLAAEATITALERLGVDAAIIFSDILVVVEPMGLKLSFQEKTGPLIHNPLTSEEDIDALSVNHIADLDYVYQAIKKVTQSIDPKIPVIGFCGAPYTLASYMIEGKTSRNFIATKKLMHGNPKSWQKLMDKLTTVLITYLKAQVAAGARVLQVFDSWVGSLSPFEYANYVLPHTQKVISELNKTVPVIYFGTHSNALLPLMKQTGATALGIDATTDIAKAAESLGPETVIQGNLDPVLLFSPPKVFLEETKRILQEVGSRPGYIFNLGHGILPETPVDHVMALVDFVHEWKIKNI